MPVVVRAKPIVFGIPPIITAKDNLNNENIVIPKYFFRNERYFAIEVLPPDLIDEKDFFVVAGNNHLVMGFLLSSLFPIWVRATSGKDEGKVDFKKAYNSFPFPKISDKQESEILTSVKAVYRARGTSSGKRLSDIYHSGDIPDHLEMAHEDLDEAVLKIFGLPADASNEEILEKLFNDYMKFLNN